LLRLTPDKEGEWNPVLVELGLKSEPGSDIPINASVLREGFLP